MRLGDVIGRWIGKVEIVLAGADEDLREGQEALALGDPMRARAAAHRVLDRAPDSPIGLALLADACEAAHLDAELAMTLEDLARRAPSSAEVWVRLGRARRATNGPTEDVRDAFVRALADLDLAHGDGARAELWLDRAVDEKGAGGRGPAGRGATAARGRTRSQGAARDRRRDSRVPCAVLCPNPRAGGFLMPSPTQDTRWH